jgi:hypothetical protein
MRKQQTSVLRPDTAANTDYGNYKPVFDACYLWWLVVLYRQETNINFCFLSSWYGHKSNPFHSSPENVFPLSQNGVTLTHITSRFSRHSSFSACLRFPFEIPDPFLPLSSVDFLYSLRRIQHILAAVSTSAPDAIPLFALRCRPVYIYFWFI